jgi:hypothetical protein
MDLTLAAWVDRVLPDLEAVLWENLASQGKSEEFAWIGQIFKVKPGTRWVKEWSTTERGRALQAGTETSAYPVRDVPAMNDATVEMVPYRDSFPVSELWMKYGGDPYIHIYPKLEEWVQDLALGAWRAQAERAAAILLDGFTGALLDCPDTRPLFDHTHHHMSDAATHYDNLSHYRLGYTALEYAFQMNSVTGLIDSHGHPIPTNFDKLVVSPQEFIFAKKLVSDPILSGATNNESNPFYGTLQVIKWPWLITNILAGSPRYWFLLDSARHTLEGSILEGMTMSRENLSMTDQIQIKARSIFEFFYKGWEGTLASTGTIPCT